MDLIGKDPRLISARFSGNFTPLLEAAYGGHYELAERLLSMGARMELFAAIALGSISTVRAMIDSDSALIHKNAPDGFAALHIASRYADPEMLGLFLSLGADINDSRNKSRLTPLFFAFPKPYANAEFLLASGANIDARAKHGFTTLHYAAKSGNENWVEFLLAHGASKDVQTDARQTPWSLAVRQRHDAIARLLDR